MDPLNQTKSLELPNATTSLVLGVLSISMCYCWGTVGLVLAIIGLSMGVKAGSVYNANPDLYSEGSYQNANSGKICSIIGLVLSAVSLLWTIFTWSSTINVLKNLQGFPNMGF